MTEIRPVVAEDVSALKAIIDATGLFPAEELDGMLASSRASGDSLWLTVDDGGPVALAYCAPEVMTEGTWNLYLLATHPTHQSQGHGAALMTHLETHLGRQGERLLIVETSGLPEFERTRAFYRRCGYDEAGRIREFYEPGDDKVIFTKFLTARVACERGHTNDDLR